MKYKFKEGQWFDVRKLTDWQKQWCLDNLDWMSEEAKSHLKEGTLPCIQYFTTKPFLLGFGGMSKEWCDIKNELTFNDFYWGEEETSSEKESVFDSPKYVTFNAVADIMDCFIDKLVDGKDYKVSSVKTTRHGKTYTLENGVRAHEEYFHKVTPQDLLPDECKGDEDPFDNLVYVEPKSNDKYYTLTKSQMSLEQWCFVIDNVPMEEGDCGRCGYLNLNPVNKLWFDQDTLTEDQDIYITFNDIFKEVKQY